MTDLNPCPFCGSANVKTHEYHNPDEDAFCQCHDCSSCGPSARTAKGAAEAWNKAARPVQRGCAIRLTRDPRGMCEVWLCFDGREVPVIRDNGDLISHYVEPLGIDHAIARAAAMAQEVKP